MSIKIHTDHTTNFHTLPIGNEVLANVLKVVTLPINTITKIFSNCKKDRILGKTVMHNNFMSDIEPIYKAGKEIYLGFILLDMINDKGNSYFILNNKKGLSLNEYVTQMVKNGVFNKDIQVGKNTCKISLIKASHSTYHVEIDSGTLFTNSFNHFKAKNKYNDNDFLILCNTHELIFSCNNSGKYAFSTKIGEHPIGGPDKIDLYSLHISNLYQMIHHITSNTENINMLVAMTTGSGKSFTQALWVFVLHCAGYRGVFAVHQETLVNQLAEDFDRLLPRTISKAIKTCDQEADSVHPDSHIITTHDILFKHRLHEFENKKYWISIDESHNATEVELYKKAIESLKNPLFFLTATPSKFLIERVGHIINLSPKEKEQQKLCKKVITITKIAGPRILKATYKPSFKERLSLRFADIIEKERLSTAHECLSSIEECVVYRKPTDPFYAKAIERTDESIRSNLRWNVHLPIGEKLLGLLGPGNCDAVINFHLALNSTSIGSVYENGNRVSRRNVYNFFLLSLLSSHGERLDEALLESYETSKKELRRSSLYKYLMNQYNCNLEQTRRLIESNLDYSKNAAKYRELSVLHGIIENTVCYLTNYNSIELNHKRRHDLIILAKEIKAQLFAINVNQHKDRILHSLLKEGIPDSLATDIATQICVVLDALISYKNNECSFKRLVDNWSLDKNLHDNYFRGGCLSRLQDFCRKHKTIFLVHGLEKTAIQVRNNRPFFSLKERKCNLQENENQELKTITKHKLSTIEALDDTTEQYYYEPEYCPEEYTEKVLDKLFKKDLVGAYITSEKTTGFNDLNLCTIGVVIDSTGEMINTPYNLIQSNRNRGLDWAKQPTYHLATKPEVLLSFDVNRLSKGNYIAALHAAEKSHYQELVKRLGYKIAKQIQDYIDLHTDLFGKMDSNDMENKLLEIIWNEYEYLYIQSNHDPEKTKQDFIQVLHDACKVLNACKDTIKKDYQLPVSAHIITFILELITSAIYFLTTYSSRQEFQRAIKKLGHADNIQLIKEKTYSHIVQNYQYKNIVSNGFVLKMLSALVLKKLDHSQNFAAKNPNKFIKKETKIQLNKELKLLLNQIITESTNLSQKQKEKISQHIAIKEDWINEAANHDSKKNDMIFSVFSNDPHIKQYLQEEKITYFDVPPHRAFQIAKGLQKLLPGMQEIHNEIECFLVKSVAHYFESTVFLKLFTNYISPLDSEHLLTILHAIYPGADNENKLDMIQRFKEGINNRKQFAEIVKACGGIQKTHEILKSLGEISQEILYCHCYYHNIGVKGEPNWSDQKRKNSPITPKLYKNSNFQEHNIWKIWVSKHPCTFMYKKMQFLSGSLKSLQDIAKVSYLDYQPKITHIQSTAQKLQELAKSLIHPGYSSKMEGIASKLRALKPLKDSLYYNAVQQARAS